MEEDRRQLPEPMGPPQRLPPQSIMAEASVLGAMIVFPTCIAEVIQSLKASDFYRPAHQVIFSTLTDMAIRAISIDLVTLREELTYQSKLAAVGDIEYLVALAEGVPSAANIVHYSNIVRRHARSRDLIVLGTELVQQGFDVGEDPAEIILASQVTLHELSLACQEVKEDGPLSTALDKALSNASEVQRDPGLRLMTGIPELDEFCGGFQPGEEVALGGRTSTGKSTLACNIVSCCALHGKSALYVSGEMPRAQTAKRFIQSQAQVWGSRFREGKLSDAEWEAAESAAEAMREWHVHIIGKPMTIPQISLRARQLSAQWHRPIDLIVVDYLQIMKPHEGKTRYEQISAMSVACKQMALELNSVVMALSQFSRPERQTGGKAVDKPPTIYDLKESGSIENDADFVLLLHRPNPQPVEPIPRNDKSLEVWLKVGKGRERGDTPWPDEHDYQHKGIKMRWHPALTRFTPWMQPLRGIPRLQGKAPAPVTDRSGRAGEPFGAFLAREGHKIRSEE